MKKMIKKVLPIGLILVASTASAGIKQGEFSVSPIVGGYTFDGDSQSGLDTTLVFGGRLGYMFTKHFGIEGLFDYVNPELTNSKLKDVQMYRYGGELLYHFMPDKFFVPYVAAGFAGINFDGKAVANKNAYGSADYGLGAKFFLADRFALRADVRHIMYNFDHDLTHNIEYTLGAYIPFGGKTEAVKPVAQPAPVVAPPPPPPAAPTALLQITPSNITAGEQATLQWSSVNASKCVIFPDVGPVGPNGNVTITPSADVSYQITCSGDGGQAVSNAAVVVAAAPVVVPPPPVVEEQSAAKASAAQLCSPTVINIQFDTNKSVIKPKYHAELDKVADFLAENPTAKGSIDGHTDSTGSKALNKKLSQSRAESVRNYLIKNKGVDASRIEAKGYGPDKPVASNKTAAGRAKNRRIEANFNCE